MACAFVDTCTERYRGTYMPREVESAAHPTEPLHYCPFLRSIFCPTCQSQCSHISALCQPRLWRRNSTFPTMTFQFFHCSLTIPSLHYSSAFLQSPPHLYQAVIDSFHSAFLNSYYPASLLRYKLLSHSLLASHLPALRQFF